MNADVAENSGEIPTKKRKKSKKEKKHGSSKKKSSRKIIKELLNGVDIEELQAKGDEAAEQKLRTKLQQKLQRDPMLQSLGDIIDENDLRRKLERKLKRKKVNSAISSVVHKPAKSATLFKRPAIRAPTPAPGGRIERSEKTPYLEKTIARWRRDDLDNLGRPPAESDGRGDWRARQDNLLLPTPSYRARKTYTGYNYRRSRSRSRSPQDRSPSPDDDERRSERQPSPPRDMPEHIRWLHERWRKYDKNFFSNDKGQKNAKGPMNVPTPAEKATYNRQMNEYRSEKARRNRQVGSGANLQPLGSVRKFSEHKPPPPPNEFAMPYYQFRKGGEYNANPGQMYTFKEYLLSMPRDVDNQDEAVQAYNGYKLQFRRKTLADFFQAHSEDEWFLERYHPMLKQKAERRRRDKVSRRLDAFMQLLVRGYLEVPLDLPESRRMRKLLDGVVVILEGGDEGDIACLSELDYMLEEKKEESYEAEKTEQEAESSDEEDEGRPAGKAPGGTTGRTREEQEADEEEGLPTAEELETMQHAKDYTLYIQEHTSDGTLDVSDLPDTIEPKAVERKTEYVGSGVFVSRVTNPKALEEMNLHKVSALLIRNVPPGANRAELEEMCMTAHGGYLRMHLTEPDPNNRFYRQAIVSYWYNANLTKILWKIRGTRLRGDQIVIIEYREFKKRVLRVDGLAADKSVVLRDIQLCKSLIEYLDNRQQLWGSAEQQQQTDGPPKANPLLINLDECLAFHLHELMEQGNEEKEEKDNTPPGMVDRDENLTRVLDRLILYLRIVHSVDYYGCKLYEAEDDEPRRIGTITVRGQAVKRATPKRLASYIRKFEERLKSLLPQERRLADEHVELLGKRESQNEVQKFIDTNVISVLDGMSKCCLCFKRFTTKEFAHKHMTEKHPDKLEEVKWVVLCFNSYLADPNRPCAVEFTTG